MILGLNYCYERGVSKNTRKLYITICDIYLNRNYINSLTNKQKVDPSVECLIKLFPEDFINIPHKTI